MKNETKAKAVKLGTKIILKFIGADLLADGAGLVYEVAKDSMPGAAKTLIEATTDSVADFFSDEAGEKARKLLDNRQRRVNFHLARGICKVWEASLTNSLPENRAANSKYVLFPYDSFQEYTEPLQFFIEYFREAQKEGNEHLLNELFYDANKPQENFYADFFDAAQNEAAAETIYWQTLQKTLLSRLDEAGKKPPEWSEGFPADFGSELKRFLFENLRLGLKEIFNSDENFRNSFLFSVNLLTVDLIKKSLTEIKSEIENAGIENRFNFSQVHRQLDNIAADIRKGFGDALPSQPDGKADKIVGQLREILTRLSESPELIYRRFHRSFPRVPKYFTGREQVLEDLEKTLETENQAAFYGTHGLGKTRAAVEYALRNREKYDFILFISATKGNFVTNAAFVGAEISKEIEQATSLEAKFNLFIALLENNKNWLVIVDNVEDVSEVTGKIPAHFDGNVIYTSNLREIRNAAPLVTIEAMTPDEAELTLLRRKLENNAAELAEVSDAEREAITRIVEKIGTLPIALNLAGAFISKYQMTFAEYLTDYEQFEDATFQNFDLADYYGENFIRGLNAEEKAEYKGIAGVFLLSYQRIIKPRDESERENLISRTLEAILNLSVFLAPEKVPEEIWLEGLKLLDENLLNAAEDKLFWLEARNRLTQAAFFVRNADENTFSTHRLILTILQKRLTDEEKRRFAELAVDSVNNLFPYVEFKTWKICNRLQRHCETALNHVENLGIETRNAARLYNQLAIYLRSLAEYEKAIYLYQKALEIDEKTIGREHPAYATRLNNLALVYRKQGRYEEAIKLYKQSIEIDEKTIGKEHPDYAVRLNNLAEVYRKQGRYEEAIELLKQALEIGEKTIGREHPDYAVRLNNLANVYYLQDRYEEAIELFKQALEIDEKTIGKEHPDYAIDLNNLANVYKSQARYVEALSLYEESLGIFENTLPENHPSIQTVRKSLELCRRAAGKG
ncbi:MAG: tetratricopeptide repeat protein [Acidobacteriota bacterium]|nr:tetratricopeptide repeat protein [Acidobacteriota bacterium]